MVDRIAAAAQGRAIQSARKESRKAEAIRMHKKGYVTEYIARVLGVTSKTVSEYLREYRNDQANLR